MSGRTRRTVEAEFRDGHDGTDGSKGMETIRDASSYGYGERSATISVRHVLSVKHRIPLRTCVRANAIAKRDRRFRLDLAATIGRYILTGRDT